MNMTSDVTLARPCLLCVDDEPRILIALKALLRGQYEVLTAPGGESAIEILRSRDVDVVISDQRMPVMTGVEVLRAARELRPRAVRVLLTGYSDLNAIIGSINEGEIFRFIGKPWNNEELRATLALAVQAAAVEHLSLPDLPPLESLRAEPAAGVAVAGTTAESRAVAATGTGVLILDQSASERSLLARSLERDWPVYGASSLEECVGLLEKHRIGVLLTESVVGGDSVTALLGALRQHQPALVAIVVTAQADAGQAMELINYGQIYRLLQKPVKESLLHGTVAVAMRRFEMLSQRPDQARRLAPAPPPPSAALEKSGLLSRIRRLLLG